MPPYTIYSVTLSDSEAIARNNMSAFWEDPNWVPTWQGKTLSFVIGEMQKRMPRILLQDRVTRRHQKAVDAATGELVGYARWVLPPGKTTTPMSGPEWADMQIADVTGPERKEIERAADGAQWDRRTDMDVLDVPVRKKKMEILGSGTYMCELRRPHRLSLLQASWKAPSGIVHSPEKEGERAFSPGDPLPG